MKTVLCSALALIACVALLAAEPDQKMPKPQGLGKTFDGGIVGPAPFCFAQNEQPAFSNRRILQSLQGIFIGDGFIDEVLDRVAIDAIGQRGPEALLRVGQADPILRPLRSCDRRLDGRQI